MLEAGNSAAAMVESSEKRGPSKNRRVTVSWSCCRFCGHRVSIGTHGRYVNFDPFSRAPDRGVPAFCAARAASFPDRLRVSAEQRRPPQVRRVFSGLVRGTTMSRTLTKKSGPCRRGRPVQARGLRRPTMMRMDPGVDGGSGEEVGTRSVPIDWSASRRRIVVGHHARVGAPLAVSTGRHAGALWKGIRRRAEVDDNHGGSPRAPGPVTG